mmetsp:Transcript_42927/g.119379  ORF Transcript_42927/g.119379 Transcript_42927/m.119379 type:complete len:215 (-) Transcript_42927:86-730(-)
MAPPFGGHGAAAGWSHAAPVATSFEIVTPAAPSYGGLMSQGYVPPGQFEDLLNLIRQASAASERAMNAAKYAEMAASAAGAAGQQAVVRAMHMAHAPGAPAAAAFAPGMPDPGMGIGTAFAAEDPASAALSASISDAGGVVGRMPIVHIVGRQLTPASSRSRRCRRQQFGGRHAGSASRSSGSGRSFLWAAEATVASRTSTTESLGAAARDIVA